MYNFLKYSLLLLVVITGSCVRKQTDTSTMQDVAWKVIGPGGGGGVMKPTISPFNDKIVLTHCDMTAMYISTNGGERWEMKNLWNVPDDFEFDPADSNVIYVATRGFLHSEDRGSGISLLLRSDDKGGSFNIVYPDVSKSKKTEWLQSTALHASDLIYGALDGTIQKVEVDPEDNNRIYLGMAPLIDYMSGGNKLPDNSTAFLVVTSDHGKTWRKAADLPGKKVLAIFPGSTTDYATVFTESSCVRIDVITGESRNLSVPANSIVTVEGGKGESGSLIYLLSDMSLENRKVKGGVFVSNDLGESWIQSNNGLLDGTAESMVPGGRQTLAVCEKTPNVAYLSIINPVRDAKGELVEIYSIYRTVNSGKNWEPVLLSSTPDGYITNNFTGSWMEESFDPGWGGNPIDLGVAPGNPDICYGGDNGRGYKTTDGGKTWTQVYSSNIADGSYSNTGLNVTTCYGIHFDPFDRNHFFICYTDMGLFHTFNGGKSWYHSIKGVPRDWQNTCYNLVYDPEVRGKVWSVWANAHDLPRTKMFSSDGFDGFAGGVCISNDSGHTWESTSSGLPQNAICTGIALDTESPAGSRILYVSLMDKGIYKSVDDGKTWKEANTGFGNTLFAWQVKLNSEGVLYALFARGLRKGENVDGEVWNSNDKAGSWNKLQLPDGVNGPHDLLIDPNHPGTMYLCCWPRTYDGKDQSGGMIKTEDGGQTWKRIFDERVRVNSAGMDPENSSKIYFNTFHNAAYRSEDGGLTWNRIEGYRFKWGQQVYPDLNNPGMLFLSTYGGSVFYGPENGISRAKDDIVNMPEGWWPE